MPSVDEKGIGAAQGQGHPILWGCRLFEPNKGNSKILGEPRIPVHSVFVTSFSNDQIMGFRIYKKALATRKKGPVVPRWWILQYSAMYHEAFWFRPLMIPTNVRIAPPGASEEEIWKSEDPAEIILPLQEQDGPFGGLSGGDSSPFLQEMVSRIRFRSKEGEMLSVSSLFERAQPGGTIALIHKFHPEEALSTEDARTQGKTRIPVPGTRDPFPCNPPGSPGYTLSFPDRMAVWPTLIEARPHEGAWYLKPPAELIEPIPEYAGFRVNEIPYHLYFDRMRNLVFIRQPLKTPLR